MAKKRKRSSRKGWLKALSESLSSFLKFSLKVFPILVVIFLTGGVFIGVRAALYTDPQLTIHKIQVEPSEALHSAQRNMLETAFIGKNILKIDLAKIARSLESDPWIQSAEVAKNFPSTLTLHITRREPMGHIRFSSAGNYGLIAADGMIVGEESNPKNVTGLVIEALEADTAAPSKGFQVTARGFQEAVKFLKAFEKHPLSQFDKISKVSYDRIGNVTILLGKGPQIRLGRRPLEVISSFEKIMALLQGPDRDKIEYIDLQFDNVIVKQKK